MIDEYRSTVTSDDDIELVRLSSDEPPVDEQPPGVTYLNYSDPEDKDKLNTLANRLGLRAGSAGQTSLTNFGAAETESMTGGSQAGQTIVFATPTRSWGLAKKLLDTTDADKIASLDLWDVLPSTKRRCLLSPVPLIGNEPQSRRASPRRRGPPTNAASPAS